MSQADVLALYGIAGYSLTVGLAVLWAGIAISYIDAGRSRRTWGFFIGGVICYALLFVGLTLVAAQPPWLVSLRTANMLINRTLVLLGAIQIGIFTWLYLRARWLR